VPACAAVAVAAGIVTVIGMTPGTVIWPATSDGAGMATTTCVADADTVHPATLDAAGIVLVTVIAAGELELPADCADRGMVRATDVAAGVDVADVPVPALGNVTAIGVAAGVVVDPAFCVEAGIVLAIDVAAGVVELPAFCVEAGIVLAIDVAAGVVELPAFCVEAGMVRATEMAAGVAVPSELPPASSSSNTTVPAMPTCCPQSDQETTVFVIAVFFQIPTVEFVAVCGVVIAENVAGVGVLAAPDVSIEQPIAATTVLPETVVDGSVADVAVSELPPPFDTALATSCPDLIDGRAVEPVASNTWNAPHAVPVDVAQSNVIVPADGEAPMWPSNKAMVPWNVLSLTKFAGVGNTSRLPTGVDVHPVIVVVSVMSRVTAPPVRDVHATM
jgi:hypothetical protein